MTGMNKARRELVVVSLALGIVLLPYRSGAGAVGPIDAVVARVDAACAKVHDLSATFDQITTNRTLGEVREAHGVFMAKRPNKVRWEYQQPEAQLFVSDGHSLWVYSPEEKQVLVQAIAQVHVSRLPLAFLAGSCDLRQAFDVTLFENAATRRDAADILDLRPKTPEAGIARMLLEVNSKDYTVEKVTVIDAYQNTTVITLSHVQLNVGLPDRLFQFTPPPGVRVVTSPSP